MTAIHATAKAGGLSVLAADGKKDVSMEDTKLEKLTRLSGKATSKAFDALGKRGFDVRGKLTAPISRVPRRAPQPKPKSSE